MMHPRPGKTRNNKCPPILNDFIPRPHGNPAVLLPVRTQPMMDDLKKKSRLMFALEIVLYCIIAITVALAIIL